jgi:hypothetical protein
MVEPPEPRLVARIAPPAVVERADGEQRDEPGSVDERRDARVGGGGEGDEHDRRGDRHPGGMDVQQAAQARDHLVGDEALGFHGRRG